MCWQRKYQGKRNGNWPQQKHEWEHMVKEGPHSKATGKKETKDIRNGMTIGTDKADKIIGRRNSMWQRKEKGNGNSVSELIITCAVQSH